MYIYKINNIVRRSQNVFVFVCQNHVRIPEKQCVCIPEAYSQSSKACSYSGKSFARASYDGLKRRSLEYEVEKFVTWAIMLLEYDMFMEYDCEEIENIIYIYIYTWKINNIVRRSQSVCVFVFQNHLRIPKKNNAFIFRRHVRNPAKRVHIPENPSLARRATADGHWNTK